MTSLRVRLQILGSYFLSTSSRLAQIAFVRFRQRLHDFVQRFSDDEPSSVDVRLQKPASGGVSCQLKQKRAAVMTGEQPINLSWSSEEMPPCPRCGNNYVLLLGWHFIKRRYQRVCSIKNHIRALSVTRQSSWHYQARYQPISSYIRS